MTGNLWLYAVVRLCAALRCCCQEVQSHMRDGRGAAPRGHQNKPLVEYVQKLILPQPCWSHPLVLSLFMRSSGVLGLWVARPSVNVGTGGQLGTHFVSWSGFPSSQDYIFHSSVLSVPEGHPCTTAVVPERQEVPLLPRLPLPDLPGTFGFLVTSLAWRRDQPHPAQTAGAVPTHFKGTEHFLAQAVLRGGSGEKVPTALLTGWKGGLGPLLCCPFSSIPRACTHMCMGKGLDSSQTLPDLTSDAGVP